MIFEHLKKHHKEYRSIPKNTEFFLDHCRLLVATGHFKLLEDTRYQSKCSIVTDISTVNSITLKQYEDDPNARWEKNVKLENTNINWKQVVNSDCLIQKITDVSEVNFRNNLKSFVVKLNFRISGFDVFFCRMVPFTG